MPYFHHEFGDTRFIINNKYTGLYQELFGKDNFFPSNANVFLFFASLGFSHQKITPEEQWNKTAKEGRIHFTSFKEGEIGLFLSFIFHEHHFDLDKLSPKDHSHVVERYADAGMEIFIEEFLQKYKYLKEKDGNYFLDFTDKKEFQKDLLVYIRDLHSQPLSKIS
jgi:hypothetical protein